MSISIRILCKREFSTKKSEFLNTTHLKFQINHFHLSKTFSEYSYHGICVCGNGSTADILENEVIGYGPSTELGQVGIMVGFGARATVTQNQSVSQNLCEADGSGRDPINQGQSVRIFAHKLDRETVISRNRIEDNDVGIYLYDSKEGLVETNDNILRNNRYFGLIFQDSEYTCSGNDITGGEVGIGVVAETVDTIATLRNNRIARTSLMSIEGISAGGFNASYRTS